jgi:hypothetical protein
MPGRPERVDPSNIDSFRGTPEALAFGSGVPKPGPYTLRCRLPLALSHCCKNMEDKRACWSGGVDLLDHGYKVDLQSVERL